MFALALLGNSVASLFKGQVIFSVLDSYNLYVKCTRYFQ